MAKLVCFLKRRKGMSFDEFVKYYETRHAPLAAPYMTNARHYTRRYLQPSSNPTNTVAPAADFDVITEIWFDHRAALDADMAKLGAPDVAKMIAVDEEKVFDRPATRVFIIDHECVSKPAAAE